MSWRPVVTIAFLAAGCLDGTNVVVPRTTTPETRTDSISGAMLNVRSGENPARGDGVHDDTSAIQSAIDVAGAARGGQAIVYLPAGEYRITTPLRIDTRQGHENVTLLGAGPQASVIRNDDLSGQPAILVTGTTGRSKNALAIRDLGIHGNPRSGHGLEMRKTIRQVGLDRVYLWDHGGDGLVVTDVSNRMTLVNCRIERHRNTAGFRTAGAGVRLSANAEQIWSYGSSIRGFGVGVHIGSYINVVGIYGGDIHGNELGLLVSGADRDDGRVSSIEIRGIYFEENGRDVLVTNEGDRFRSANVVIAANSFSKTTGRAGTYGRGTMIGEVASVTLERAESCSIESNEFRKITSNGVRWAVRLGKQSRSNRVLQSFIPRAGVEHSTVAAILDEGNVNWGQVSATEPDTFVYPGNVALRDGVIAFGAYSLWVDGQGQLRIARGTPDDLTSDGRVVIGSREHDHGYSAE